MAVRQKLIIALVLLALPSLTLKRNKAFDNEALVPLARTL